MTTREQWLELAERCEKAEGPDRELDARITVACFKKQNDEWGEFAKMPTPHDHDIAQGCYWLCARSGDSLRTAETLTASLDAITALIEREFPGYIWVASRRETPLGSSTAEGIVSKHKRQRKPDVFAKTPALALCAAFCRQGAAMAERAE